MWDGVEDKRDRDGLPHGGERRRSPRHIWLIGSTTKEAAPRCNRGRRPQPTTRHAGSTGDVKETDPIRNRGQKVGRNDPCPCGSGKKYKNCHMRQTA